MSVGTAVTQLGRRPARPALAATESRLAAAWPAVLALTVLAAVLRFYRLGHQGFWFDEANTALLVHLSPGKMLGLIPQSESTPPLYYCLAWVWARIFGYGETGLRSVSALAGVLVVPVAYGAAARLVSVRAGVITAALVACNPLLIWYAQEARSYELLVLFSGLSLLGFAYLLERPTAGTAAGWVIASALALATHYYAILLIVPEAICLLVIHRRTRAVQTAVGLVALGGLALIPLALSQQRTGRSNWIHHASLARRLEEIVPQFVIGFGSPAYGVLEPLAIALVVFGLVLLASRSDRWERGGAALAGGLALAGLVLNLLLVAVGIDDLLTRNLLALWLPATVAVAGGLAAARARVIGGVAAAALCAIGIVAAIGVAHDRDLQRPDWRPVARLLGPPVPGGRMILIQHYRDLLPLSLYMPGLRFLRGPGFPVSELDVISFTSPPSAGFCWWGAACNLWPSRMQRSYAIRGFTAVGRQSVNQFTVLRMVARSPRFLSARAVAGSLTTTRSANNVLVIQP
ncbi:MAG: glycosyltransferase family 39 protein [Solirubrobacterales bacterium]|nr:glycosyltransferase family 39 protein [Solirubrobacterales bacterium]